MSRKEKMFVGVGSVVIILFVVLAGSCTPILPPPNITGEWYVNTLNGLITVDLELNGLLFTDKAGLLDNGAIATNGLIQFSYKNFWYYGNVTGNTMLGFVRLGEAGTVVGAWEAEKK